MAAREPGCFLLTTSHLVPSCQWLSQRSTAITTIITSHHSILISFLPVDGVKRKLFTVRNRGNIFRESSEEDQQHTGN